jgi:CHAT domain
MQTRLPKDFDLLIEGRSGGYRASVTSSPAGEATIDFKSPFTEDELEIFLLRVGRRRTMRGRRSSQLQVAQDFGAKLFEAVFQGEVRACLRSSLDQVTRDRCALRLRLRFSDAPEMADLPWEYLYYTSRKRFLAMSAESPLVRYIDLPEPIAPLIVTPPLRIVTMISSPTGYPELDVEREFNKLHEALYDLEAAGVVMVERLKRPTLSSLQRALRRSDYHVFHFIGHGTFDAEFDEGLLVLETEKGEARLVPGSNLGAILHQRSLRLAVLNSCEGARGSKSDPYAGIAHNLVHQRIPAVIAMQFEISDDAAITFAHEFYGALADGLPVDAAVTEARLRIYSDGNDTEWGTPVVYLRSEDGRIFEVSQPSEKDRKKTQIESASKEVDSGQRSSVWSRYKSAIARTVFWIGAICLFLLAGGGIFQRIQTYRHNEFERGRYDFFGCWYWTPTELVSVRPDGTLHSLWNGDGTWEQIEARRFKLRWQRFEDDLRLSDDGNKLFGKNQFSQQPNEFTKRSPYSNDCQ